MPLQAQQADNEHTRLLIAEYERLELILLDEVASRLRKNESAPDWVNQRLNEITALRKAAAAHIGSMVKGHPRTLDNAISEAARKGVAVANSDIEAAGARGPGNMRLNTAGFALATDSRAIALLHHEASFALNTLNTGILRATEDLYRNVVAQTVPTVISGVETRVKSTQRALDEFAKHGIKGFTDKGGRTWSMTAYAEMATRTAATRALTQSHQDRLLERGYDLVVISSHPRPAPQCQPYERQVLSLSGGNTGVVEVENALTGKMTRIRVKASLETASSRGLFHPNCRHTSNIWLPGVTDTTPTKPNDEGYEDTQKLRYLERQTRDWKRRSATALTPEAKKRADAKVKEWQKQIREHTETTGVGRRRDREQITGVYGAGNATRASASKTNVPKLTRQDPPAAQKAAASLSQSTRDLVADARSSIPKDRAGWLDTTLKYPKDKNGAKLVPEKLQRHLDTTLDVGTAIQRDTRALIDKDTTVLKLRAEDKQLTDAAQWLSPRRNEIQRDIARREQSIIQSALSEVRAFGGAPQSAALITKATAGLKPGTAAALAQLRAAEQYFPTDWLVDAAGRGTLRIGIAERAFFRRGTDNDTLAAASFDELPDYRGAFSNYPEEVMVHELGHRMEQAIPGLTQLEYALVRSRSITNGTLEEPTGIYEGVDGLEHEIGYEDQWRNKYAGKTYATDAQADPAREPGEVFQVGLQDTLGRSDARGEFDETGQLQAFVLGVLALL
nr:phage minor capsid protein [uncultured Rhodococcus sp.]